MNAFHVSAVIAACEDLASKAFKSIQDYWQLALAQLESLPGVQLDVASFNSMLRAVSLAKACDGALDLHVPCAGQVLANSHCFAGLNVRSARVPSESVMLRMWPATHPEELFHCLRFLPRLLAGQAHASAHRRIETWRIALHSAISSTCSGCPASGGKLRTAPGATSECSQLALSCEVACNSAITSCGRGSRWRLALHAADGMEPEARHTLSSLGSRMSSPRLQW